MCAAMFVAGLYERDFKKGAREFEFAHFAREAAWQLHVLCLNIVCYSEQCCV
jgi:hypothetical protein